MRDCLHRVGLWACLLEIVLKLFDGEDPGHCGCAPVPDGSSELLKTREDQSS